MSQPQPRDWFAVLFGSRKFNGEVACINQYTDVLRSICLEEGVLLSREPHRRTIFEEDNPEYLVGEIRKTLDSLQSKHGDELHFPLILVVDDQTLFNFYEKYVEPTFANESFIYSLESHKLREYLAMGAWDQVREDIKQQKEIFDEFNLLPPIPLSSRSYRSREDEEEYGSPTMPRHRPPRDEDARPTRRMRDVEQERVRPVERTPPTKSEMTPDVVKSALRSVHDNPTLLDTLAEDMHEHIRYEPLQIPRRIDEQVNMLELFVLAGENTPPGLNSVEKERANALRKDITKSMHRSGLLARVRHETIGEDDNGLHVSLEQGQLSDEDLKPIVRSIRLILRAFLMISKYNLIDNESLELWDHVETPVFFLPGRFWIAITKNTADTLCHLAAQVTTQDPSVYEQRVRVLVEEELSRREEVRRLDAEDRRGLRPPHNGHADDRRGRREPGSPAYRYDYDLDETDTPEASPRKRRDGPPPRDNEESRSSTPNEMDLQYTDELRPAPLMDEEEVYGRRRGRDEEGGRGREQYGRMADSRREKEEEEERRAERQRRGEDEPEAAEWARSEERREYERIRRERALEKWEESDESCIAWRGSDEAPPTSFRILATRPVYSDLYLPQMPYMRKALITGAYIDNEHYLDVQFRLMREDMVAPLRDGIYGQKMQIAPGELIRSSNELKIYPTIEVGALQVRSIDGAPMRVVNIPQHMLTQIREERQLKFGQCVVLSSDKFTSEFHVGWICDRFQDPGMPWQGRLAIAFFDEGVHGRVGAMPIDRTATFALAESPAYLEAYTHVLRVLKKMKKNVAFPLERYLVHMKKNTRLPQYMRWKEEDEDKAEDKERLAMYEKKQREEEAKKKEKEKKKMPRSASREDDEDELTTEEHVTTEEGTSEENLVDDGFNTDEEDHFLTRRHSHPNPKDLEMITIGGRSYHVERLMEEYETTALDETQRRAMCYALTSELAIIQGPPGTGKTHIGVEIVMAILENRIKWRMTEPILVVTFSNQALDHFLDKVRTQIELRGMASEDTPAVVRLGSRSEHDAIKLNCLLSTVMKDYEEDLAGEAFTGKIKARKNKESTLKTLIRAVKTVQISRTSIMEYNTLRQAMGAKFEEQLRQAAYCLRDSSGNPLNMDEVLVSWLLNKTYEKKRDLPPDSDEENEKEEKPWAGALGGIEVQHKPASKKPKKPKAGGRETKKEKNERRRAERRRQQWNEGEDSSDTEDEGESDMQPSEPNDGEEEEEEGDVKADHSDDIIRMLQKLNECTLKDVSAAANEEKLRRRTEKYEMEEDWEVEREFAARGNGRMLVDDVEIFSNPVKGAAASNRFGKGGKQVNVDPNIVRDIREHKQYILAKDPMTEEEVKSIHDVRSLPKETRWRLLVSWQRSLAAWERSKLDSYMAAYETACEKAEIAADISRAAVLKKALIVGATTTGSAKRRTLLSRIGPKVLVVEEAAEVLEAHLLASIVPSVQHAIFIGDHQQLRPSTAVHHLAKMANMEVSLFERLVKNGYPYHTLGLQHRMLAPLTEHVVRPHFYQNLQDAPSIFEYPRVEGFPTNLFFWAHRNPEDYVQDSMSKRNCVEAEMCYSLANYILMQGQYKASEITIIGMYSAQVVEIKRGLQNAGGALSDVAVETVDSFQGKENRVMILSLVRSRSGGVGFLAIANRITVALTRAQHGMYVCGNMADIASYSPLWDQIVGSLNSVGLIDYYLPVKCQRHGTESAIHTPGDFFSMTRWGGCDKVCGLEMHCGHPCKQQCHPPYQHDRPTAEGPNLECQEECVKRCEKCGQKCPKKCQEPCGKCHQPVSLELDCGHTVRCECGARHLARCKEPCEMQMECGHFCQNKCSAECVPMEKCEQGVDFTHPICRHDLVLPCNQVFPFLLGQSKTTPACYENCPEYLVCGHKCPRKCGEPCPTMCEHVVYFPGECGHQLQKQCSEEKRHIKCTSLVDSSMPHCSHRIKIECYQNGNQSECRSACKMPTACGHECSLSCGECYKRSSAHECSALCTRELQCGHRCQERCGKPCVCRASCRVRCAHQRCGQLAKDTKGGTLSYGRSCSQPCVTCVELCDNHCEHKSCSKKCFEVCDMREPCSEPCREVLKCGHACLGLCGESCPKLCGTCTTANYKTTIGQYPIENAVSGELTRLIELPGCEHIFPYKYMDKQVKEQLAAGCIVLRCPRCRTMIEDCKRYIRVTKRLWKEADDRKWEKKMADEEMSNAELMNKYREMRDMMKGCQDEVARSYSRVLARHGDTTRVYAFTAYRMLDFFYISELRGAMGHANSRNEFFYWQAVVSCHKSICGLVLAYLQKWELLKMDAVQEKQPNLRAVLEEAFERRRNRYFPMIDQFKLMVDLVKDSLEYRMVGHLVPSFRAAMIKNHLYYHMEHLNASLRHAVDRQTGQLVDLTPMQTVTYKRVIRTILMDPPSEQPHKKLEDMVAKIGSDVYDKLLRTEYVSPKIELPEF